VAILDRASKTPMKTDSPPPAGRALLAGFPFKARLLSLLAFVTLFVEGLMRALLAGSIVVLLFLAASFADLPRHLPGPAHVGLLALVFALLCWVLWRGFRGFRLPDLRASIHRLETDSALAHRPLSHLSDAQASNLVDPAAARLWSRHRQRLLVSIARLVPSWPQAGLAVLDPRAIRHLSLLLAVLAFFLAGDAWQRRLEFALLPDLSGMATGEQPLVEAWITPPAYTGLAPVALSNAPVIAEADDDAPRVLEVPIGSRLLVQAQGVGRLARLVANDLETDFTALDEATQRAETELATGEEIAVEAGFSTLVRWSIKLLPDLAPRAAFPGPPEVTDRGVMRLIYSGTDDFGIVDMRLDIRRDAAALELKLPLAAPGAKQVEGASFQDLTAHPWAGLAVEMRLVARDALGQVGASAPISATLPERKFFHPVARAIVEARKKLVADWPGQDGIARARASRALDALKAQPEALDGNIAAFMGLDFAARRLASEPFEQADLDQILRLMWDMALDLEDSGASLALNDFRRLQQALEEALARGASDEEIERLMNALQTAMNEYLRNLEMQMQRAVRDGATMRRLSPDMLGLSRQDLNRMLEEAKRMAQAGARDSARQLLDRLQNMMENLQAGIPMPGSGDARQQAMMQDLARIMKGQQDLLQQSFNAMRGRQPGTETGDSGIGAAAQERLRRDLGELMRKLSNEMGDLPQGLGGAEQAMRDAVGALKGNDYDSAAQAQGNALDQLQQGLRAAQQMLQRQAGIADGPGQRERMDPFGRPARTQEESAGGNATDIYGVTVPDAGQMQRARQIFEELWDRRNDPARPRQERDYIDRLLKQY
jgi:uncharacterized protein (TIGR02302 family)